MFESTIPQRPGMLGTRSLGALIHQRMTEMTKALANDIAVNLDVTRDQYEQIAKSVSDFGDLMEESFGHVVEAAFEVRDREIVEMANVISMEDRISG